MKINNDTNEVSYAYDTNEVSYNNDTNEVSYAYDTNEVSYNFDNSCNLILNNFITLREYLNFTKSSPYELFKRINLLTPLNSFIKFSF